LTFGLRKGALNFVEGVLAVPGGGLLRVRRRQVRARAFGRARAASVSRGTCTPYASLLCMRAA